MGWMGFISLQDNTLEPYGILKPVASEMDCFKSSELYDLEK